MDVPRNFIVTAHAQKRAAERGITKAHFLDAVTRPDRKKKQRRGEHGGTVYLFSKRMSRGDLRIVAELVKDDCIFITGYWI